MVSVVEHFAALAMTAVSFQIRQPQVPEVEALQRSSAEAFPFVVVVAVPGSAASSAADPAT